MNNEEFDGVIHGTVAKSLKTLTEKGQTYSTEQNRFHNFDVAASLTGQSRNEVIASFMSKHIVSVFDMVNSKLSYSDEVWDEKLGDAINYLLILRASVADKN